MVEVYGGGSVYKGVTRRFWSANSLQGGDRGAYKVLGVVVATKPNPTKKKAQVKVDRGKCLNVLSEVALSKAAQVKEVKCSKRRAFWSLNEDILKITVLKTNTPYPSRKIRRIRACTHQRPQRNNDQYAVSRENQYVVFKIWNQYNILEDIKRGPYSKKSPIRRYDKVQKNELWLLSMFEANHQNGYANVTWLIAKWMKKKGVGTLRESLICCGQFMTRIVKRLGILSDEVLNGLSALTYCRTLDANILRELIGSNRRLIPEEIAPSIPRVVTPRAQRPTTSNLYDKISQLETRIGIHNHNTHRTKPSTDSKRAEKSKVMVNPTLVMNSKEAQRGLMVKIGFCLALTQQAQRFEDSATKERRK
ncbi:hypothetical protein Tco_0451044 [Tanacetum coccineum]